MSEHAPQSLYGAIRLLQGMLHFRGIATNKMEITLPSREFFELLRQLSNEIHGQTLTNTRRCLTFDTFSCQGVVFRRRPDFEDQLVRTAHVFVGETSNFSKEQWDTFGSIMPTMKAEKPEPNGNEN